MTRERNRDRDRTKTREEWQRENEARVARGEQPIPESEMNRELDERNQADEPGQERAAGRPAPRHGQEIEEFTPEVPTLRPDYTYGEGRWNNPENVKDAIHYFEHERPREREQQQAIADELEKERGEAAMQQEAERIEQIRGQDNDAGEIIRRQRPDLFDEKEQPEEEKSYDRNDAADVIRRNEAEREARKARTEQDREHDIEHDR